MSLRLWPRRFIQPSSRAALQRRHAMDDGGAGEIFALGFFLLVGVLALASTATAWQDGSRRAKASDGNLALSAAKTEKRVADVDRRKARKTRLAMAGQASR